MKRMILLGIIAIGTHTAITSTVGGAEISSTQPVEKAAETLVRRLMEMPSAAQDPRGRRNPERWQVIRDIGALGDAAIPAIDAARASSTTTLQRSELAQSLGAIPSPAATRALLSLLDDKESSVRQSAISGLCDRVGTSAENGGTSDILPALAKRVAGETDELNRQLTCTAMLLAKVRVVEGVKPDATQLALAKATLIDRLRNDPSANIRCIAACHLTQFGDNPGLSEIKKNVLALKDLDASAGDFKLDQLTKAVERITGKSFGPMPLNPMLVSNTRSMPGIVEQRKVLIEKLLAWAKEPDASMP